MSFLFDRNILLLKLISLQIKKCLDGNGRCLCIGLACFFIDLSNPELLSEAADSIESLEARNHKNVDYLYAYRIIIFIVKWIHINV